MADPFVHVELTTTELDKAKTFYQSLFDWKLDDMDMGGGHSYTMVEVGEGTGGGMMAQQRPGAPSAWLPYVNVDNLRAATDKPKPSARRSYTTRPRCRMRARSRLLSTRPARCSACGSRSGNRPAHWLRLASSSSSSGNTLNRSPTRP